jgi:hypothetical protein
VLYHQSRMSLAYGPDRVKNLTLENVDSNINQVAADMLSEVELELNLVSHRRHH